MAKLPERLRLDLPDPFAGDVELAADLLERSRPAVLQPEPKLQDPTLATGEGVQDRLDLFLQELVRGRLGGSQRTPVFDEVAEMGVGSPGTELEFAL